MSWDMDAMSVLPESWQDEVAENFSPELLAERLSDYVVILKEEIERLTAEVESLRPYRDNHHELIQYMARHDAAVIERAALEVLNDDCIVTQKLFAYAHKLREQEKEGIK